MQTGPSGRGAGKTCEFPEFSQPSPQGGQEQRISLTGVRASCGALGAAEKLQVKLGHPGLGGRSEPGQGTQRLKGRGTLTCRVRGSLLPALTSLLPPPLWHWLRQHVFSARNRGPPGLAPLQTPLPSPRGVEPSRRRCRCTLGPTEEEGGLAQRPAVWPGLSS